MARGPCRTLITALLLAGALPAAAQNPPPASSSPPVPQDTTRRDSTARDTSGVVRLLYSDVIVPGGIVPRVRLTKGTVFTIEVDPGGAEPDVRFARRPSQPGLFVVPLRGEAMGNAEDYLVVPPSTEDYFVGLANGAGGRIRIWFDPRQSARYARIRAEGFRLPILALGVSATYLAPFRDARPSAFDPTGATTTPRAAYGAKLCLDVLPNGRLLPDRTGGCAVAFTLWRRGAGRNFFTVGIEPEVIVVRRANRELGLTPQLGFGNTTGGTPQAAYAYYGLGARYTVASATHPHIGYQAQASILELDSSPDYPDPGRVHTFVIALQAGVVFKL